MKSNNPPKRHHYVQESYQKWFRSDNDELFVLDKQYKTIRKKAPSQICYIDDLHTISFNNEKIHDIEIFYRDIESQIVEFFKFIEREVATNVDVFLETLKLEDFNKMLRVFIAFMFWRNPSQKNLAKEYAEKLLDLYDASHDEVKKILFWDRNLIKFLHRKREKENYIKIIQYVILPLVTFKIFDERRIVLYYGKKFGEFISCDNPVVNFGSINELLNFEKFVFPLNNKIILSDNNEFIKTYNVNEINIFIAKNSKKYIFGSSRELLTKIQNQL